MTDNKTNRGLHTMQPLHILHPDNAGTACRAFRFIPIVAIYIAALAAAVLVYISLKGTPALFAAFLADIVATLAVWLAGVLLGNSSVYDPYWSVAPVFLAAFWAWGAGVLTLPAILLLAALLVWGVRLTLNWARRWRGLTHQDWRYTMYRQNMPKLWPAHQLVRHQPHAHGSGLPRDDPRL